MGTHVNPGRTAMCIFVALNQMVHEKNNWHFRYVIFKYISDWYQEHSKTKLFLQKNSIEKDMMLKTLLVTVNICLGGCCYVVSRFIARINCYPSWKIFMSSLFHKIIQCVPSHYLNQHWLCNFDNRTKTTTMHINYYPGNNCHELFNTRICII